MRICILEQERARTAQTVEVENPATGEVAALVCGADPSDLAAHLRPLIVDLKSGPSQWGES